MLSRLRSILFGSDEEEVEVIEESAPLLVQMGPPLMVLVSTGGILSFRLHTFLDVGQAAEFVQPWFPPGMSHGIVAFWALQEEPVSTPEWGSAGGVETFVLVRDPARPGVVDLIECVDMESAHTLIRAEAERGLDIGLFMVYWAAQVSVQVDDEGLVRLTPASPPPTRQRPSEAEPASQVASTEPRAGASESEISAISSTTVETPAASPVRDVQRTSAPAPPFDAQVPVDEPTFAEIEPELLQPPATDTVEAADALTAAPEAPAETPPLPAVPEAPAEAPPLPAAPLERETTLPKVIIIDHNEEARAVLGRMVAASRFVVAGEAGFGNEAIELAKITQPEIIMVAAEAPVPRATRMMEAIASALPNSALVAYSALADSRNIRGAILAGADDYLVTPIGQEDLASSLQAVLAHKRRRIQRLLGEAAAPAATGRVITVFGAKGGIGKTTIATNLAVAVAQRTHQSVVLVDLDPRFGDVGFVLDMAVEYSIADLAMPEEEIDREVIESCLYTHVSGVKVLAAPWHPTRWRDVQASHVDRIIGLLAQAYDCVVLDTPGTFNDVVALALERASDILLVTSPHPTSIKDSLFAIRMMESGGSDPDRIKIVVNLTDDAIEAVPEEIGRALGRKVAWTIPYDPKAPGAAVLGMPVVMTESRAAGVLREMALTLIGDRILRTEASSVG